MFVRKEDFSASCEYENLFKQFFKKKLHTILFRLLYFYILIIQF